MSAKLFKLVGRNVAQIRMQSLDVVEVDDVIGNIMLGLVVVCIQVARFDLSEDTFVEKLMIFGEIYRHNGESKFKAIGQGFVGISLYTSIFSF